MVTNHQQPDPRRDAGGESIRRYFLLGLEVLLNWATRLAGLGDPGRYMALREVDCLERDALGREHSSELPVRGWRTEQHFRIQQQGGGSRFGAQDVQTGMATLHLRHDRHNLSRVRQADVVGKRQHAFKRHGPAIRVQAVKWSR
jgi:hypothetical protein